MTGYKQEEVEKFETDWRIAKRHLEAMAGSPIVSSGMYMDFTMRMKSIESLVMDISDYARSDKD